MKSTFKKEIVITILIVGLVVIGNIVTQNYTKKCVEVLNKNIEDLKQYLINKEEEEENYEAEEIMKAAVIVANLLKEKLGIKDINLLNNSGQLAGQTVMHFHLHVLPRYGNDEIDFHQVDHEPNFLELDKLYSILKP